MSCLDDVRPVVLVACTTGEWGDGVLRELQRRGRFSPRPLHGPLPDLASLTLAIAGCCAVAARIHSESEGYSLLDAMADAGASHLVLAGAVDVTGVQAYAGTIGVAVSGAGEADAAGVADALERPRRTLLAT